MMVLKKRFYIEPQHIAYFRFITEGHEGICLIHTVNPKLGLVDVTIPPQLEKEFYEIIKYLREELKGDNLIELYKFN